MKIINLILMIMIIIGFAGCGNTKSDANTYNLQDIFKHNYYFNTTVKFSDDNNTFEYISTQSVKEKIILNSIQVTPVIEDIIINNKNEGTSESYTDTFYYDNNGILIESKDSDNVICSLENIPTKFSTKNKIGDSGIGSYLICTDGSYEKHTWELLSINNNVIYKNISTFYNSDDSIFSMDTASYYLDNNGIIIKWFAKGNSHSEDENSTYFTDLTDVIIK